MSARPVLTVVSMADKRIQLPPVQVTTDKLTDIERRAKRCGLNLTEYIRYRCYGAKVLTGEQVDAVKEHETLIE